MTREAFEKSLLKGIELFYLKRWSFHGSTRGYRFYMKKHCKETTQEKKGEI